MQTSASQNETKDMRAPKDLDELWEQQAQAYARLENDPKLLDQTRELANTASKLIDIVKIKLTACNMAGMKPDIPQMGKLHGGPALPIKNAEPAKQFANGSTIKLTAAAEELIRRKDSSDLLSPRVQKMNRRIRSGELKA
jgi:hypothetical protein